VNALRHGFSIASLLKAQRRSEEGKGDDEEDKQRQQSAELVLEVWCETAERVQTLGQYFRGRDKDFYRRTIKSFDRYHYSPRNNFSPKEARAKDIFERAFGIIDIMQEYDWQVVQQLLGYWIRTMYVGSSRWLYAGYGEALKTDRHGPRHQDPHWLRMRKRVTHRDHSM
jgi:hypothetical protein